MGINSATLKFKNNLLELINNSGLPICIVDMVMGNVMSAVQVKLKEAIEEERKEQTSE